MNANELANLLEVDSWYKLVTREEIATMLRQQQAEIEALKTKEQKDYEIISDLLERNVALKSKTLTDEEIISCIDESEPDTTDMIRFARAILRKAQEK
jgi:glycine cleavage system regulatory protein